VLHWAQVLLARHLHADSTMTQAQAVHLELEMAVVNELRVRLFLFRS